LEIFHDDLVHVIDVAVAYKGGPDGGHGKFGDDSVDDFVQLFVDGVDPSLHGSGDVDHESDVDKKLAPSTYHRSGTSVFRA